VSIWANVIKRFTAPSLPKPTPQYDQKYFDALVNVLRLYFNQLDNLLGLIVSAQPVNVNFYGTALDAFGRARFSQPYTLFDSQNRYAKNDLFSETTATGGAATYIANESTVNMTTTTSSGSEVVRQTYRSFPYQPGKGLLVMNTFVIGAAQENQRVRVGYFNTENGVFFELDGTTLYMVRRTYVTGTAVDTRVPQAEWNGDKLNGTGDSALTIDITKAQIFWQDFEWLGVGSVRTGFIINGQTIICHTFQNANNLDRVYMTTAILPVRYEIRNTGVTASAGSLRQICSTVISEGGYEKRVMTDVARMTAINTNISTTFVPLVSIRLASGRTGAVVIPDGYSVLPSASSSTTFEVVMVKNPTLTGPTSWVATSSTNVEMDISSTGYTGGTIAFSNYVQESMQASSTVNNGAEYNWDMQLGATIGGVSDIYTIAVRTLSGTHNAVGSMSFWDLT
jgi:hypothetical protein